MTEPNPSRPFTSPACQDTPALPLADPDLTDWLQELLRAERAGARIMLDSARQTADSRRLARLEVLRRGEVESCRRLLRSLERLGCPAGNGVSDFYDRAMAIENFDERLVFIQRGQRWVARQLQQRLPGIDQAWLREELEAVLELHRVDEEVNP